MTAQFRRSFIVPRREASLVVSRGCLVISRQWLQQVGVDGASGWVADIDAAGSALRSPSEQRLATSPRAPPGPAISGGRITTTSVSTPSSASPSATPGPAPNPAEPRVPSRVSRPSPVRSRGRSPFTRTTPRSARSTAVHDLPATSRATSPFGAGNLVDDRRDSASITRRSPLTADAPALELGAGSTQLVPSDTMVGATSISLSRAAALHLT
jgi:hypothetical protein